MNNIRKRGVIEILEYPTFTSNRIQSYCRR